MYQIYGFPCLNSGLINRIVINLFKSLKMSAPHFCIVFCIRYHVFCCKKQFYMFYCVFIRKLIIRNNSLTF